MPGKRANVENWKQYEALEDKGISNARAAKIAIAPGVSKRDGKMSHSGSGRSDQGGTTSRHEAAGREGGQASATKH